MDVGRQGLGTWNVACLRALGWNRARNIVREPGSVHLRSLGLGWITEGVRVLKNLGTSGFNPHCVRDRKLVEEGTHGLDEGGREGILVVRRQR